MQDVCMYIYMYIHIHTFTLAFIENPKQSSVAGVLGNCCATIFAAEP